MRSLVILLAVPACDDIQVPGDVLPVSDCSDGSVLTRKDGSWSCVDLPMQPTNCLADQFLTFQDDTWTCIDPPAQPTNCAANQVVTREGGAWSCIDLPVQPTNCDVGQSLTRQDGAWVCIDLPTPPPNCGAGQFLTRIAETWQCLTESPNTWNSITGKPPELAYLTQGFACEPGEAWMDVDGDGEDACDPVRNEIFAVTDAVSQINNLHTPDTVPISFPTPIQLRLLSPSRKVRLRVTGPIHIRKNSVYVEAIVGVRSTINGRDTGTLCGQIHQVYDAGGSNTLTSTLDLACEFEYCIPVGDAAAGSALVGLSMFARGEYAAVGIEGGLSVNFEEVYGSEACDAP